VAIVVAAGLAGWWTGVGCGGGSSTEGCDPPCTILGSSCAGDTDCVGPGTATCLTSITVPVIGSIDVAGGYCTATCDAADPESCGPGSWCINLLAVVYCMKACTPGTPGECREEEGYICFDPASMPYLGLPGPFCVTNFY
jgi:hypothetical protein